jgi:ubiquinone/menaquinone biosynthesis C-methylase UbiE
MSNQYSAKVAEVYELSFTRIPLRRYVEQHSVYQIFGDVSGISVLDLACGTGYYTRELRRRGAARVVGVDLSEGMIQVARSREIDQQLGVEYVVADAGALGHVDDFDIVSGIHLLHYANSLEHLEGMCRSISRNLTSGGRFIGYQINHEISREPHYYDKYCFQVRMPKEAVDGQPFTFSVAFDDFVSPQITAYYWSRKSLEAAFDKAGLTRIRWVVPAPSPEGIDRHGAGFWDDLMRSPFELITECWKR